MSIRRLVGTAAAMAAIAVVLRAVTPDLAWLADPGLDLPRAVDTAGADTVLLAGVAALAWAAWLWGCLGLVLTVLSALPGTAGALARAVTRRLLPAGARRAAALTLGVGLATSGPLLTACSTAPGQPAAAAVTLTSSTQSPVADWPAPVAEQPAAPGPVPDWPSPAPESSAGATDRPPAPTAAGPGADRPAPTPGDHVVLRGECLWDIAADDLRRRSGAEPADGEVAAAVTAWWRANTDVIGPDPDLLLPGQVLRPPAP
ncbi:hypothetical protein DQ238_21105 [Geodermatophilus sp. TF02-6]|uniref:LysM peptidoglycan-binding domain-containing protein n=1 Tax=Geodermatophilus sp. TF02-6 TaxID=2250575 RepID=UPI000DE808C5|nr:hypothetical protein [Geodermatophilus sp. TF02-6]RBY74763.1 hypothetical protein DQ238_21105 [Geodermatophilus sp. TF02-6]